MLDKMTLNKFKIKNIITLNIYNQKQYIYKPTTLKPLKSLTYNKLNFISSFITSKDIICTTIYLSSTIPNDDISDVLNIKAYEELALDESKSYVISYDEVPNESEERQFNVFAVDAEILDNYYSSAVNEVKYIDLIQPAPLLLKSLYTNEIIEDIGIQGFLYFTMKDAFIVFYKNGEYLYSKSIEYSLENIYQEYIKTCSENINEKKFYSKLYADGLNIENFESRECLTQIFNKISLVINDIILYTKRLFRLERIDHLYIGSELGIIGGLTNFYQKTLQVHTSEFNFDYGVKVGRGYTDQFQILMVLSTYHYLNGQLPFSNLTLYPRPPSFTKRASGQFIIATVAAIALSLAYPLSYLVGYYTNNTKNVLLGAQNSKLEKEVKKYKAIISKKQNIIKVLNDKTKVLSNKYHAKSETLSSIYDKKVNYKLKSEIFHTISEDLSKFDVKINNLYSQDDYIKIAMVGEDDRRLTELIKYISTKHFNEIESIDIESIDRNSTTNHYKGLLKVKLK